MIDCLIDSYPDLTDQGLRDICFGTVSGTPLHAAASMGQVDVVRLLLGHVADNKIMNNEGMVALELAVRYGRKDVVEGWN